MKIIERIEIHRFRSIGDESIPASDINIYSGVNNSGKSNILRALNLFFNQETSYDSPFDFDKDYNNAYTGQAGGAREIRVTLHFAPKGEGALQYPFSITRSFRLGVSAPVTEYHSTDHKIQSLIDSDNGNVKRQFTLFLNSVRYFYIPAVRDKRFVRHLFLNFEQIVRGKKGEGLEEKLQELSDIISARSESISKDFEQFLQLPTKAVISSELRDILGSIQVNVDSGLQILKKARKAGAPSQITPVPVDLFSSGDGVLMSYLAYFLAHLCRETPNIRYIWGFEEPENSLEYSKVQKLADEFVRKFNRFAQIFLTTHSPAFVDLRHLPQVGFYRAYIEPNFDQTRPNKRLTRVRTLADIESLQLNLLGDVQREQEIEVLRRELGMVEFSQEIERAAQELHAAKREHQDAVRRIEVELASLQDTYPKNILIIEDSKSAAIATWQRLLAKSGVTDVKILSSEGCTTNKIEEHLLLLQKNRPGYQPRVFRQIDRDGLLDRQVEYIEGRLNAIVASQFPYKLKVLPVNEVENFAIIGRTIDDIKSVHQEDIRNKFDNTAKSKLGYLYRTYHRAPDNMFRHGNDDLPIIQEMRAEALRDWNLYMPGKDICGHIGNFNPIAKIQNLEVVNYPSELRDYIGDIKAFFQE